jgi:eukaryotic-like serine/threonine-protein kinase
MTERSAFDSLTGVELGNYLLEQRIEQSEAGPVFRARELDTGALFRLRLVEVSTRISPEDRLVYLGRFQQVANQIASLHHAHILPLVDYGTQSAVDGRGQGTREQGVGDDPARAPWPYLVSPSLPVKSLSAHLAQQGPLDAVLASRYLDQISAALEFAHQQGVLHRNLTTDCVFLKENGTLLVADFGVMRIIELGAIFSPPDARSTTSGMSAASAPAPEQILGRPVDTYTDVYALGAVLYRMLTGHRVFRGKTPEEIFQQHLQAPIPPLGMWRSDLPPALDGVIALAMAKEPTQRFRQPGALANAYHDLVARGDGSRIPFSLAPMPSLAAGQQQVYPEQGVLDGSKSRPATAMTSPTPRSPGRSRQVSRRRALTFIATGAGAAAALLAAAFFGRNYLAGTTSPTNSPSAPASAAQATGATTTSPGGKVLARASAVPTNSAKVFPISGQSNPGVLIHVPDGRFVAFDSTCTHAGCAVTYRSQDRLLACPCHGATFDPAKNAAVVQGPATTPLAALKISVNPDGTITQG